MAQRILVPLALAPRSEGIFADILEHASARCAEVVLLHIVPSGAGARLAGMLPWQRRTVGGETAAALLDVFADRLRAWGIRVRTVVCAGDVAATVADVARREGIELVIVGQGAGRRSPGALLGGRAAAISRRAPGRVLLARPEPPAPPPPILRAFDTDAANLGATAPHPRGTQVIPVARIIGSVGRAGELDAGFRLRSRRRADNERYARVLRLSAGEEGIAVSPIAVYQLGQAYYVVDGHRRVAAAKELGQDEIAAVVTEHRPVRNGALKMEHGESAAGQADA